LFLPEESRDYYDVTFKTIAYRPHVFQNNTLLSEATSRQIIGELVNQVKNCLIERGIDRLVFFFEQLSKEGNVIYPFSTKRLMIAKVNMQLLKN
jgi:hypothetical protein